MVNWKTNLVVIWISQLLSIAARAMVAAYTPERRSGVALGSLSAAVYMGSMTGAFAGGMFAEYFGCCQCRRVPGGYRLWPFGGPI